VINPFLYKSVPYSGERFTSLSLLRRTTLDRQHHASRAGQQSEGFLSRLCARISQKYTFGAPPSVPPATSANRAAQKHDAGLDTLVVFLQGKTSAGATEPS